MGKHSSESKWIWDTGRGTRNELLATPVFHESRVYLASGQYVEHGEGPGERAQGERAIANPICGLIWEYTQQDRDSNGEIDFEETFHRTLGSVAIKDGLLIAADFSGEVAIFRLTAQAHEPLREIFFSDFIYSKVSDFP